MNALKGYRTLLFNLLSFIIVAGGMLTGTVTDPVTLRWIAIVVILANAGLRILTTGPVGKQP